MFKLTGNISSKFIRTKKTYTKSYVYEKFIQDKLDDILSPATKEYLRLYDKQNDMNDKMKKFNENKLDCILSSETKKYLRIINIIEDKK
jgi:hypothetical protein